MYRSDGYFVGIRAPESVLTTAATSLRYNPHRLPSYGPSG